MMKRIFCLFLCALLTVAMLGCSEEKTEEQKKPITEEKVDTVEKEETLQVSDRIFDFTFSLNGTVYQLPSTLSAFLEGGWEYAGENPEEKELAGGAGESVALKSDSGYITARVFNISGNQKKIKDCRVMGVLLSFNETNTYEVGLAKGVLVNGKATQETVAAAWGEPTRSTEGSDLFDAEFSYSYLMDTHISFSSDSDCGYIFKTAASGTVEHVAIMKYVRDDSDLVASRERPAYLDEYVAPTAIGAEVLDYSFRLDERIYQLPAPLSQFLEVGWKLSVMDVDKLINGGQSNEITVEKGEYRFRFFITNFSETQVNVADTMVTGFSYETEDILGDVHPTPNLELPKGIRFGMTKEELVKALEGVECSYYNDEYNGDEEYELTALTHLFTFEVRQDIGVFSIKYCKMGMEPLS